MKTTAQVVADSQVANCFRFGYQQVIHITSTMQTLKKYLTSEGKKHHNFNRPQLKNHPKSVHPEGQAHQ
jgi:hypothetical protein